MECPTGKVYHVGLNKCIDKSMLPGSKGRSRVPCPTGEVWNPHPTQRRCVSKKIYEQLFGAAAVRARSAEQKALTRKLAPGSKKPAAVMLAPASPKPVIVGLRASSLPQKMGLRLETAAVRANASMPPGLTRDKMTAWIATNCINQDDPASMDPYNELEDDELRSMVRLGSGFCYTADTLDRHVKASIERGIPVRNMLNPGYRLNGANFGALQQQGRLTRKSYNLPTEPVEIPAAHYKLFIGVIDDPEYKFVFVFDERKTVKLPGGGIQYTEAIPEGGWLGYIPVTDGDNLERLIKKAYQKGRLFTKVTKPFKCCRFHLKKDKVFWHTDLHKKIKAMEEEISDLI